MFWGDLDGGGTYAFSAETSFKTPDGYWGRIFAPPASNYESNGGQFLNHDFTITTDDSLILVYEFDPYVPDNVVYLFEAKLYIPEIINYITSVPEETAGLAPESFTLYQNYPNPFNPSTIIKYSIPQAEGNGIVTLKIYDILGKEIATLVNEKQAPGNYEVQFNAVNLPTGVYFYKLSAGNFVDTKKMILLR